MQTTSLSLLQKIQFPADPKTQETAWSRFVELYGPILLLWARRLGAQDADAADLVQGVFTVLVGKLPDFCYDPARGGFRRWLRTILVNRWRNFKTSAQARHEAAGIDHPDPLDCDAADVLSEEEYRQFLVARALEIMQTDFEPTTYQACWRSWALDQPARKIAADLGISTNAVYLAKTRVLPRLRQELAGFLE